MSKFQRYARLMIAAIEKISEIETQIGFAFSISENTLSKLIPLNAKSSNPAVIARRRRYFKAETSFAFMCLLHDELGQVIYFVIVEPFNCVD